MPIYAYRCASCGHTKDVLRKLSDPPLNVCPACGAEAFAKQVTAAGFQLKGSGWYATDFKGAKKPDAGDAAKTDGAKGEGDKTDAGKSDGAKSGDSSAPAKAGDAASPGASSSGDASSPKAAAGCGGGCACH